MYKKNENLKKENNMLYSETKKQKTEELTPIINEVEKAIKEYLDNGKKVAVAYIWITSGKNKLFTVPQIIHASDCIQELQEECNEYSDCTHDEIETIDIME